MRTQSQKQIIAAARKLFATRGYYRCKVADIAREAGMSTGNIYWYYEGKEEILRAILANGFESHEAVLRDAAAHPGTTEERVDFLVDQYLDFLREQQDFFSILIAILGHSGTPYLEELGFDMRDIEATYHRHLSRIIVQGQKEGTIIKHSPDALAMLFFSLFNGMLLTYGEELHALPDDVVRSAIHRLMGIMGSSP